MWTEGKERTVKKMFDQLGPSLRTESYGPYLTDLPSVNILGQYPWPAGTSLQQHHGTNGGNDGNGAGSNGFR